MPDLVLVRHSTAAAAAEGAPPGGGGEPHPLPPGQDAARPLTPDGRERAVGTGRWLASRLPVVDVVLVSAALRTRQTWALLAEHVRAGELRVLEELYTASPQQLVHLLAALDPEVGSALVVGHEPVLSVASHALTGRATAFSPGTAAVLAVPSWAGLGGGAAALGEVHRPR